MTNRVLIYLQRNIARYFSMLFSVEKGRRKDTLYSSIIKKIHTITIFAGVAMDKKDNKAELLNGVYGSICETIGFENTVKLYQQLKGSQINFPTRLYSKEYVTREATRIYDGTSDSLNKIATEYNYSERTIRKLLKKKNEEE